RQSFGSCSHGNPPPPLVTPALLKRRLHAPYLSNTCCASASTESKSLTSVATPSTSPRFRSSPTVSARTGCSMSAMTTRAPSSSRASTMPRPMPLAPPVTTATLPAKLSIPLHLVLVLPPFGGAQLLGSRHARDVLSEVVGRWPNLLR